MSKVMRQLASRPCLAAIASVMFLAALATGIAGCNKTGTQQQDQAQAQSPGKRYHLVGKIVQVQSDQDTLVIDGQDIPGFMGAMTMPYRVRAHADLAGLGAGDEITADVVVGDSGTFLENIVVTKKRPAAPRNHRAKSNTSRNPAIRCPTSLS